MLFKTITVQCDAPELWQIAIQDPATPIAEGMLFFHNYLMYFVIAIGFFVYWMLYVSLGTNSKIPSKFSHSNFLEVFWTVMPAFILVFIAIPSFSLLYSLDELSEPAITLKVVGHQWYWTYEFDLETHENLKHAVALPYKLSVLNFDSYMLNSDDLTLGSFRLLEVDNRLVLPIKTHIRVLVTSSDVLHSWAIPSFGIKVDATPGRLSQASLFIKRSGVFYGQCSEICGINHGFMPIVVETKTLSSFFKWFLTKGSNTELDLLP